MSASQFQDTVLLWLSVIVVLIPVLAGVGVLLIQNMQKISEAWAKLNQHDKSLQDVNTQLNGQLDRRIEAHVNKAMANASNSTANSNPNSGGPGAGGI